MAEKTKFPCMVCPAGMTPETGVCDKCGAKYSRGELIEKGAVKKAIPIRQRPKTKEPSHINFDALPWTSHQRGASREEAIENLFNYYDAHPGLRRLPAREAFEVIYATESRGVGWKLTVQRRNRNTKDTPTPVVVTDEKATAPKARPEKSSYEGKRGRHPVDCGCSKHGGRATASGA